MFEIYWIISIEDMLKFCKQCTYVKFKSTMTKWPVQKQTHRLTQKHVDATDIKKQHVFVFSKFGLSVPNIVISKK